MKLSEVKTKDKLLKLKACDAAIEWAGDKSIEKIWSTCHRGDWMLWLFIRTNPDQIKELTKAKAHCALTVRHLMKDQRSIDACEVAIKFADGLATEEELRDAADDAYAAHVTAYANAATYYAAYVAAARAAYVASADVTAAYVTADAAAAAATAAADSDDAARIKNRMETANICRAYLPLPNF